MRIARLATLCLLVGASIHDVVAQAPPAPGPTFEVVSIKPNTTGDINSRFDRRPDGGVTIVNLPVRTIVAWAYPEGAPTDFVGMPAWAEIERYDVSATSPLSRASDADRTAMLRAMLTERFKLSMRVEKREQQVYDLVLAREDGRLGPGITRSEIDCEAKAAADRAAAEAAAAAGLAPPPPAFPMRGQPRPPCILFVTGPKVDAEGTIDTLAQFLRGTAGRVIVNKTGLKGSYQVSIEYDRMAGLRGPDTTPGGPPSLFTAVQEQLGLKLEPSRAERDTFIIERLERPTEN